MSRRRSRNQEPVPELLVPVEGEPCNVCAHPLRSDETVTCSRCIAGVRACLSDIGELWGRLPDALATLAGVAYDGGGVARDPADEPVLGGDALVMLAGGTAGGVMGTAEGDRSHAADQWLTDPPSAAAVLASIEDDWRHCWGWPAAPYGLSVRRTLGFLREHLTRAAEQHPGFPVHREDLVMLRSRMQVVVKDDAHPVPVPAPCMWCGGRVVRRWRSDGLDLDAMDCERCGRSWSNAAAHALAQRAAIEGLPESAPAALVTLRDLKLIFRHRVPANTLDQWVARGRLVERGRDVRGDATFQLADAAELVVARERRARAREVLDTPSQAQGAPAPVRGMS